MIRPGILLLILFLMGAPAAESIFGQSGPDPTGAFWRSLVLPGWGHQYVDGNNWRRGQTHLAAEIVLGASYLGFRVRASNLEVQYITHANMYAGTDISDRNRAYRLAIGDYDNLNEYNDYQLRSRNWDKLYEDTSENRWNWQTPEDRHNYRNLRSDVDRIRNQIPAILGLMVVNRVVSAISAYNRARNHAVHSSFLFVPGSWQNGKPSGIAALVQFRF